MSQASDTATRCFDENLRRYAPPDTQPEKFNLYHGFANLARAIADLEAEVGSLRQQIRRLER